MKCPMVKVLVTRQANEGISTTVFAHQILLLQMIHGEDAVQVLDEVPVCYKEISPTLEFTRLSNLYGNPPEEKRPYVELMFGSGPAGRLRDVMARGMEIVTQMLYQEVEEVYEGDGELVEGPEPGSYDWTKAELTKYGVPFNGRAKKIVLEKQLRDEFLQRLEGKGHVDPNIPLTDLADLVEADAEQRAQAA